MSSFILKMIALITMIVDHTGVIFQDILSDRTYEILRVIGRLSFIIYAFLIAEGCKHTKNFKKYLLRLLAFAFIIEAGFYASTFVPSMFGLENAAQLTNSKNIFFTLFLGAFSCFSFIKISEMDLRYKDFLSKLPFLIAFLASNYFDTDYGGIGVAMIFFTYLSKTKIQISIVLTIGLLLTNISSLSTGSFEMLLLGQHLYFLMPFSAFLSVILIYFYNGKKGLAVNKWFFYLAYPFHFIVLYLAKLLLS